MMNNVCEHKTSQMNKQDYLYRYQPFNEERMRILFVHSELFFYSLSTLNDPFDSKVDFSFEGCDLEDIKKFHEKGTQDYLKRAGIQW